MVVGAFGIPTTINPGEGFDGVAAMDFGTFSNETILTNGCTGSLLYTGRHMITAAHCVDGDQDGTADFGSASFVFEMSTQHYVLPVTTAGTSTPPEWTGSFATGDVAIVELPVIAPYPAERYQIFRGDTEEGRRFVHAGYGNTGTGATGSLPGGSLAVKRLGHNEFVVDGTILRTDFDDGSAANNSLGDSLGLGESETTGAQGDSGSAAFLGSSVIAGINSTTNSSFGDPAVRDDFGDLNGWTRVSSFAAFIDGVLATPDDIVLDMNFQPAGNDGVADQINVRLDPADATRIQILLGEQEIWSAPAAQVLSITIRGSGDDDILSVFAGLGVPVSFDGGLPTSGSDQAVIVGTSGADAINVSVTDSDSAVATVNGGPNITIDNTELLRIDGQGGGDNLTYTTPAGETDNFLTPGVVPDAGTINSRLTGGGPPLLPVSYENLAASGSLIFADTGGGRADDLTLTGTNNPEVYNVTPAGDLQIRSSDSAIVRTVLIQTPGVAFLYLNGAAGDDVFNVPGDHPFTFFGLEGGDPSASDVLNFNGSGAGAVTVNIGTSTVQEAGFSAVTYTGVETINASAGANNGTLLATTGDDSVEVTPTGTNDVRFRVNDLAPTVNFTNVGATMTVNGAGGVNTLIFNGTAASDTINLSRVSASPTLEVAGRQLVTATNTFSSWTVRGHDGTDTFNINDPGGSINTILIVIDAGAGIGDSLNYTTDRSQTYFPGSTSGSGELQSSTGGVSFTGIDTATVTYTGGFVTTVNAGAGANQITATGTVANTVAVTVDNNTTMNFVALQTLNLNAGSGDDVISVRPNALAITAINVDGGDPTASDTVIVNGTAAQDNVTIAPTAADAATVTGLGPTINVTTTEHLTYNGQGGGDNLTYTTLAGETDNFLTPGVVPDAGTINSRRTSGGAPLLPVSYTNLAASGTLIFADTGGGRADDLTLTGTDNPEIYNVTPTGDLQIRSSDGAIVRTVLIQTPGVAFLYLNGAAGDDVFNVSGGHPFTFFGLEGGDPSASDTLNFTSSGGAVTVDLAAQTVTEAGFSPLSLTGIEVLNVTAGAAAILINGTANPDNISVTPTSATEATIVRAGQNLTINTSNSSTLTIDPLGGSDNLRVNGTQAGETITVTGALVTVDAVKTVNYANAENLQVFGQAGDDTFEVTPSATTTIFIDGGDPIGTTPGDCIHITAPVVVPEAGPEIDEGGFRFPGTTLQRVSFDHIECIVVTTDCAVILGTNGDDDITIIARDDSYDPLADGIQDFTVSVNGGLEILYTNTDHLYIDALAGDDDIVLRTPAPNNAVWDVDVFIAGGTPSAVTGDQGDVFELETPFAQDVIYTPTGSDSGHIDLDTVGGGAEIANIELGSWTNACGIVGLNSSIGGIEEFVYDGEGASDNFTIVGTAGDDTIVHTPGAGRDEGTLRVNELLGVRYQNLGLSSILTVDGAAAVDTLVVQGTANSDVFAVAGTTGAVTLNNRIAVNQTAVENLRLNGLAGDDTFNLTGVLPYTNVLIDADATVNLAGAVAPVTVNLGDNSPGSANPNTVINGYGAAVVLIGVDTANMDANGQTVTTIGTSQNDNIIYTPSGAAAGTFFNNISSGNNLVPNTVFNFSNAAAGSVFTVFGGTGGNADQVTIRGTDARDLIQIQQGSATAQVLANNVTALMSVQLATNVEILNALGLGGQDTFQVIPAPGLGNSPDNLLINLDGGAGGENNALVVAGSFGAAPATLAANQFVVVNRGRTPDTGTVRVFTAAVPNPDINYKSVQVVSPLVAGGSVTPNSIFIGPDNFEQNDQLGNAAFLGAGSTLQVQHASVFPNNTEFPGVPSDQDFYRVVTQTTGTLDFQVYFRTFAPTLLPGGGQINLQLFDVDGTLIASAPGVFGAAPGTGNARIRIPAVQGQTYFLRVFGATADVVNGYDITVIDTAPPVPFDLELDDAPVNPSFVCPQVNPAAPNSDTGRSQFDNITCDNTPTIFLRLDDAIFLQDLPGNSVPDSPPAGVIPIPFQPGPVQPVAPGYAIAIFDEGDGTPGSTPPQVPLGFATAVAGEPGVYTFTPLAPLTDGSHFLTARVQMIDPAIPQQRGFGARSVSLEIIVDIVPPSVSFGEPGIPDDGVISDSDTGVSPTNPDTLIDLVTRDTTPTFWGRAEADAIIRVYADVDGDGVLTIGTDVFLGQDTAIPLDGTNQEPDGFWKVESVVSLIDPDFFPIGGERTIFVTAEDVAGNTNAADGTAGDTLVIFIDVQGPQITDVEINNVGNEYDLFDPKPSNDGPTPLVRSIVLSIQDLPVRTADFLIAAIKDDIAENPGHYLLTGDYNGIIPIQDVIVTLIDPVEGEPARATIELVFWEWEFVGDGLPFTLDDQGGPLPDDRYTLFVNDEGIIDRVGNILDGESNADEPHDQDQLDPEILGVDGFPSGDGLAGGDFIARFTIDSVAEVGTFGAGSAWIDTNGNTSFDPTNGDFTNRDITYILGLTSDDLFAGNFAASVDNPETIEDETIADGFDKLAAYGRFNGVWRWLVDTDNDGVPNVNQPDPAGINGLPVAGNFDGNPLNGDEVGVFTGTTWWFDTNHDFKVDTSLVAAAGFVGYPIVGDFDGDGNDDLAVWTDDRFKFDLSSDGLDGAVDAQFRFGFPGANERPVAADVNGDGFDDIGLFVPNQASASPDEAAEWYILVSGQVQNNGDLQPGDVGPLPALGPSIIDRIVIDPIDGQRIVRFTTKPFGRDIYLHYGDEFSLPIIGNFDPPVTAGANDLPSGGYNTRDAQDVNNDGIVSAIDALLVVNHLNRHGSTAVTQGVFTRAPFLDVNNNGQISATDALTVINKLNASASQATSGAEGEADEFFSALGASSNSSDDDVLAALANDLENQRRKK